MEIETYQVQVEVLCLQSLLLCVHFLLQGAACHTYRMRGAAQGCHKCIEGTATGQRKEVGEWHELLRLRVLDRLLHQHVLLYK